MASSGYLWKACCKWIYIKLNREIKISNFKLFLLHGFYFYTWINLLYKIKRTQWPFNVNFKKSVEY